MGRQWRPFSRFRPVWTGMTGARRIVRPRKPFRANPWAETGARCRRLGHRGKMTDFNHATGGGRIGLRGPRDCRRRECAEWRDERARHASRDPPRGRRGPFPPLPCRRGSCATAAPRSSAASVCPPATAGSRHWPSSSRSPPRARHRRRLTVWCSSRAGPARAPKTHHGVPCATCPFRPTARPRSSMTALRPGRDDRTRRGPTAVLALGVSGGGPLAALRPLGRTRLVVNVDGRDRRARNGAASCAASWPGPNGARSAPPTP
jgi:hypothetical protein